jgi:type IV pilus assembly protein PilC
MKLPAQINLVSVMKFFSKITFLDKLLFTKHLSIMIKSGITIVEALEILTSQTKSPAFRNILESVSADVKNGKSLAEALQKHPKAFDTFYTSIIEIGETSGTLDQSLLYLSGQLAKDYAFRKKIQGAMLYPMIVFTAAGIVGIGVSLFVLPQLLDLFSGYEIELPLSTQILIFIAKSMQSYGVLIFIYIGILLVGVRILLTFPAIKPYWHQVLLVLPIFGKILQNSELTSFCRNLGIMLKSGLPITKALAIEENITSNLIFQKYLKDMLSAVDKGTLLSAELESGKYKKIPLIATKMIAVGEKTGKLEETFLYLGDFFEDEVDDATRNISTIIEPIMLLFIGLIVAFVALSIISPIYELTSSIKR